MHPVQKKVFTSFARQEGEEPPSFMERVYQFPWVSFGITAIVIGISYRLFFSSQAFSPLLRVERFVPEATQLFKEDKKRAIERTHVFVEERCQTLFGAQRGNTFTPDQLFRESLSQKVIGMIELEISNESKIEIVNTVLVNFQRLIKDAERRVLTDLHQGKLVYFGIQVSDKIQTIHPLGGETHHHGQLPLQIVFQSGRSVVYKPHSMVPEYLLCDIQHGILSGERFGTYRIREETDEGGDYGYAEFLENREEENTIGSKEELREYVRKMCVLEKVCRALEISDIHYQNVITRRKEPCIIDAEVFLNPPESKTGVLDMENGPLHVFDWSGGWKKNEKGKNRIWVAEGILTNVQGNVRFFLLKDDLERNGIDVDQILTSTQLRPQTVSKIAAACTRLLEQMGRYVLIGTDYLKTLTLTHDHREPQSLSPLYDTIVEILGSQGFILIQGIETEIRERICEDIRNHDLPFFYYYSQQREVIYNGLVIARKIEP